MIDGIWWIVILVAVVAALWLLAHSRGTKDGNTDKTKTPLRANSSRAKLSSNDALQKTAALLKKSFPDYRVTRKNNHLLISKKGKKIAMITIDKKIAIGQRRLGEVPVINYHRAPSRAQLSANLQNAE
ncbi:hypothetical protein [Psychrobacter urativorans]|uniref:Uncharacterized protein n=1 Tax=Psychrobacter urativorans TaxID=45610 RepID=A0A0M4SYG4_9GAMM|nr:hypothetical protein [Psychrobacter urativorans]ALF60110.1 hypothetical protein AOC03_08730 [Psychrobacter urativorans]